MPPVKTGVPRPGPTVLVISKQTAVSRLPTSFPYSGLHGTRGKAFAVLESVLVEHPSNMCSSCSTELGPAPPAISSPPTPPTPSQPGRTLRRLCSAGRLRGSGFWARGFSRVWSAEYSTCMLTGREPPTGLALWAARHTGRGAPCWGQLSYEAVVPVNSQTRSETPLSCVCARCGRGMTRHREQELGVEV